RLVRKKKLGRNRDHLELLVEDETGARGRVLWWNAGNDALPPKRFDLAYTLRISRFHTPSEVVLELRDLQSRDNDPLMIGSPKVAYEIEDYSARLEPAAALAEVLGQYPDAVLWREDDPEIAGCNRTELDRAETFIIWTTPPGPEEWQAALDTVRPSRIVVFGQSPRSHTVESFLQRLGGLLKYVINAKGGKTTLQALAAATAQRVDAVRYGLLWFEQSCQLGVDWLGKSGVLVFQTAINRDRRGPQTDCAAIEQLLKSALAETVAYRKHWTV